MGCRVPTAVQSPCGHTKTAYVGGRDTGFQPNPSTEGNRMWMLVMTVIGLSALTLWAALVVASDADDQLDVMRDRAEALRALERLQDG